MPADRKHISGERTVSVNVPSRTQRRLAGRPIPERERNPRRHPVSYFQWREPARTISLASDFESSDSEDRVDLELDDDDFDAKHFVRDAQDDEEVNVLLDVVSECYISRESTPIAHDEYPSTPSRKGKGKAPASPQAESDLEEVDRNVDMETSYETRGLPVATPETVPRFKRASDEMDIDADDEDSDDEIGVVDASLCISAVAGPSRRVRRRVTFRPDFKAAKRHQPYVIPSRLAKQEVVPTIPLPVAAAPVPEPVFSPTLAFADFKCEYVWERDHVIPPHSHLGPAFVYRVRASPGREISHPRLPGQHNRGHIRTHRKSPTSLRPLRRQIGRRFRSLPHKATVDVGQVRRADMLRRDEQRKSRIAAVVAWNARFCPSAIEFARLSYDKIHEQQAANEYYYAHLKVLDPTGPRHVFHARESRIREVRLERRELINPVPTREAVQRARLEQSRLLNGPAARGAWRASTREAGPAQGTVARVVYDAQQMWASRPVAVDPAPAPLPPIEPVDEPVPAPASPVRYFSALHAVWDDSSDDATEVDEEERLVIEEEEERLEVLDEIDDTESVMSADSVSTTVSAPPVYDEAVPRRIPYPRRLGAPPVRQPVEPVLPRYQAQLRVAARSPSPSPPYNAQTDRQTLIAPIFLDDDEVAPVAPIPIRAAAPALLAEEPRTRPNAERERRHQAQSSRLSHTHRSLYEQQRAVLSEIYASEGRDGFDAALDMEEGEQIRAAIELIDSVDAREQGQERGREQERGQAGQGGLLGGIIRWFGY